MCLPCLTDVYVEEEPKKKKKTEYVIVWDARAKAYVKVPKSSVPQPLVYPQPAYVPPTQPIYQPYAQVPYAAAPAPYPSYAQYSITQPVPNTFGHTGSEVLMQNMQVASDFTKKQEMKPADDDPYRMYWCREQDDTWTQRNRMTIDSGDLGDCRWYAMDGQFYVVRLGS